MIKVHKILEHKNLQNSTINYSGVSTESEWTYYYNNLILLILPRNQYPSENGYYAEASAIARTTRACISKCHFFITPKIKFNQIPCEKCNGTGLLECPDCGGFRKISLFSNSKEIYVVDCKHCSLDNSLLCTSCNGRGFTENYGFTHCGYRKKKKDQFVYYYKQYINSQLIDYLYDIGITGLKLGKAIHDGVVFISDQCSGVIAPICPEQKDLVYRRKNE